MTWSENACKSGSVRDFSPTPNLQVARIKVVEADVPLETFLTWIPGALATKSHDVAEGDSRPPISQGDLRHPWPARRQHDQQWPTERPCVARIRDHWHRKRPTRCGDRRCPRFLPTLSS